MDYRQSRSKLANIDWQFARKEVYKAKEVEEVITEEAPPEGAIL